MPTPSSSTPAGDGSSRAAALFAAAALMGAVLAWVPVLRDPRLANAALAGLTARQERLVAAVDVSQRDGSSAPVAMALCEDTGDTTYLRYLLYPLRVDEGARRRAPGAALPWDSLPAGALLFVTVASGKALPADVEAAAQSGGRLQVIEAARDGVAVFRVGP